jgi:iron(III) transport system substrate-binding protein
VAKAKAEGGLMVYGAPVPSLFTPWLKEFEKEFGIPVQYYRAPTNTVYQRFSQEQEAGRNIADVLALSDLRVIQQGVKAGYVAEYTPANAALFPKDSVDDKIAYPLFVSLSAVGWNTQVVPKDLQDALLEDPYAALLDPRLKDKIAIVDVTAGGAQLATQANFVFNQPEKYGWAYLEKLAAQKPTILRTSPLVLDGVISSDYWATTDAYDSTFIDAALKGAPVAYRTPDPVGTTIFYTSVSNNAPHPYTARLFTEWATSLAAQSALSNSMKGVSVMEGWQDQRGVDKLPWYRPPQGRYSAWANDERLAGDSLKAFYAKWAETFGQK